MLNILTYVLIVLSVVSAASFQIMSMFNNNSMLINSQSEKLSLNKIVSNIEESMTSDPVTGEFRVLVGENLTFDNNLNGKPDVSYHTIPSGMGMSKINSWGKHYIYCPIGGSISGRSLDSLSVNNGTKEGDSSTYQVKTFSFNGLNYIAESESVLDSSIPSNVVGLILSPYSRDGITPSCSDVTYDGENYLALNSMVRAIIPGYSTSSLVENINLHSGTTILNSYNSLIQNTEAIKINLDFSAKDYSMTDKLDFCFDDNSIRKQVFVNGYFDSENSTITKVTGSGIQSISICNADVFIEDVVLDNVRIKTKNSSITLKDSTLNEIDLKGSKASLSGTVNFNQTGTTNIINLDSSELNGDNLSSLISVIPNGKGVINLINSDIYASNSNLSVNYTSLSSYKTPYSINVDESSSFSMKNGSFSTSIEHSSEAILNYSKVSFSDVSILSSKTSRFIGIYDGATFKFDNSNLSVKSGGYAVNDISGLGVFGKNSTITSTYCWSGDLFKDTFSDITGSSKSVNGTVITNRSDWQCN